MDTPITIQPTPREIVSCTHCGRAKYRITQVHAPSEDSDGMDALPTGVRLFELAIPGGKTDAPAAVTVFLCATCLREVIAAARGALEQMAPPYPDAQDYADGGAFMRACEDWEARYSL